jgi:FlaA1/EpsC-like NDP-sugar epimerase
MSLLRCNTAFRKSRKYILMFIDSFIAAASYFLSMAISGIDPLSMGVFINNVIIYTAIYVTTFVLLKVYRNMLRFSDIVDNGRCLIASTAANFIFFIATKALRITIPLNIYLSAYFISSLSEMAIRTTYRATIMLLSRKGDKNKTHVNTMIIGAGQATATILNEIKSCGHNYYSVKCILDDDKTKIGRNLKLVPVVGNTSQMKEMVERYKIEEIIISESSFNQENKIRIMNIAANTKCKVKILPEIYQLLQKNGSIELTEKLRTIRPDDLLGRAQVQIDCELTRGYINDKVVLVTGGGGSIGSELCRQISSYNPKELIILDEYENNAYEIQQELLRSFGSELNMEVDIVSVRDQKKLEKLFSSKKIDLVFHAAAHKHVPLMESNPDEAIKNNIFGTYNVALMADKYKAKKFVLISTDKAVNPTNVMGATKRICEMIIQYFDKHSSTDYVAVRFGNVLGSNGSVIPLFIEQIKSGGPVTVTHEEITRYFMTIPEAVKLVLRAASIAKGGEIFVLDMGQPVKIKDMAYNLIMLSGLRPNIDIKIEYVGLRPGEKLYEELLVNGGQVKTGIDKIFIEEPMEIDDRELIKNIMILSEAAENADLEKELSIIEALVPTYQRFSNCRK